MPEDQSYKQKQHNDDTIFNSIQKHYITMCNEHVKSNNVHLSKIIQNGLIPLMKVNPIFKDTYQCINYAGSFYKGTKVGKPDEYDLDLVVKLPLNYKTLKIETNHGHYGYVKIKVGSDSKLPKWEPHCKILNKWLDADGYLEQTKFYEWMENVMTKTYDQLKKVHEEYELIVNNKTYILKQFKKHGPAFRIPVTLKDGSSENHTMDVDIVPCLQFDGVNLDGYKVVPDVAVQKILVVAKPAKDSTDRAFDILWRLSFYEQEKAILATAGQMKPIIRMIKKLRDSLGWKKLLASYYIETLCLHELQARESDRDFLKASQTCLFIHMLKKLRDALALKNLPYFWHEKHNLIEKINGIAMDNYANRLNKILTDIEKNRIGDRFIIANYILQSVQEVENLRMIVIGPKPGDPVKRVKRSVSEPADSIDGPTTSSVKTTVSNGGLNIDSHIEQICNSVSELLKFKDELTEEQKEKMKAAFANFTN